MLLYPILSENRSERRKKIASGFNDRADVFTYTSFDKAFYSLLQYLTKQNIALKEVNDSRMQIYETLDVSIRDLEIEKHGLMVQTSNDKKLIKR